jgi:hypothetical protein
MGFTKLRELRDRFEQQWINGGFIFGYENEINENHNNDYPLLVVLPPTSELPATEGDVQEEYTFECLVVKPYYQNQAGSLDVVFSLLEQEALTWLQRVLDSYANKEVILSPDSISVEREKELYNDKLIQVRLTFTLNAFSHDFTRLDEAFVKGLTPLLWLKADMGVKTEFFGGNEVVNKWIDQSGNGNHFEQTTSTYKPLFKYEEGQNGYPYLEFDGANGFMKCVNDGINSNGLNEFHTIVWVALPDINTSGTFLSKKSTLSNTERFEINSTDSGSNYRWKVVVNDDDNDEIVSADTARTRTAVMGYYLHNKSVHLFADGVHEDTETNSAFDHDGWDFGTEQPIILRNKRDYSPTEPFKGQVQELIIFNSELTDEQIVQVQNYLKHKYNI